GRPSCSATILPYSHTPFCECDGQPIQQRLICGRSAGAAQILNRRDDADAEVLRPDAVNDDASRQWIVAAGEPVGEGPAAAGGLCAGWERRNCERTAGVAQYGREAPNDGLAMSRSLAANWAGSGGRVGSTVRPAAHAPTG